MGNIFEFSDRKYEKGLEAKHTGKHKEVLEAPDQIPVPEDHINEDLYADFEGYTEKMDGATKDALMEDQNFLKSVARTKRDFRELFQTYPSVKNMVGSYGKDGEWVLQKVIMDLCFHNADRVLTRRAEGKPESTGKNPYLFGLSHYEKARILATRLKQYDAQKAAEKARQAEGEKAAPAEETEIQRVARERKKAISDRVRELTGQDVGEIGPEFKFDLGGVTFRPQFDSVLPNGLIITDEGWGSVSPDHLFWVTGEYDGQTMSFGFKVGDPTDLVEFNKVTEQSEDFGASDKGDLEKWIEGRKINIRKEGVRQKFNTVFGKNVADMKEGRLDIEGLTFTPIDGDGAIKSPDIWLRDGASYRFNSTDYKGVKLELAVSVVPPNLFSVSNGPNFSPLGTDTEAEVNAWVKREKARIDAEQQAKEVPAEQTEPVIEKVTDDEAKIGRRKADVLKKVRELAGDNKVELGANVTLGGIEFTPFDTTESLDWSNDSDSYWFTAQYEGNVLGFGVHLVDGKFEVAEDFTRVNEKEGHGVLQGGADKATLEQWVIYVKHKIEDAKKPPTPEPVQEGGADIIDVRNAYVDAQDAATTAYERVSNKILTQKDPGAAMDSFRRMLVKIASSEAGTGVIKVGERNDGKGNVIPFIDLPNFNNDVKKWPVDKLKAATESARKLEKAIDEGGVQMFEELARDEKLASGLEKMTPKKPEGQIFERREVSRAVNRMIMQYVLAEADKDLNAFNTSVSNDSVFLHLDSGSYLRLTVHRKPVVGGVNIYFSFGENPDSPDFLIQPNEIVEKRGEETIKLNFTDRHMKSRYVKAVEGLFEAKMGAIISKVERGEMDAESVVWKPQDK